MLKGFLKLSVLGFMVNGMDNFCFATFSDGPSSLGSEFGSEGKLAMLDSESIRERESSRAFDSRSDDGEKSVASGEGLDGDLVHEEEEQSEEQLEQQLEEVLGKKMEDYGTLGEVEGDLRILRKVEEDYIKQGRVWQLPIFKMSWRRVKLEIMKYSYSRFGQEEEGRLERLKEQSKKQLEQLGEQLGKVLNKKVKDYGTSGEVEADLRVLGDVEGHYIISQGEIWQPIPGMNWKRIELEMLQQRNIENMIKYVCEFLREKQQQYGQEYKKEIEEIYSNQGMSDVEEKVFYENVVFLNQVRNGRLYENAYENAKQELFGEIDGLLEGVSFWRKS